MLFVKREQAGARILKYCNPFQKLDQVSTWFVGYDYVELCAQSSFISLSTDLSWLVLRA